MKGRLFALLVLLMLIALHLPAVTMAQTTPVSYARYDVDLALQENGDLQVAITQVIDFNGEFSTAFFEIPRAFTADISDVVLQQIPIGADGALLTDRMTAPSTMNVTDNGETLFVEWTYPQTQPGDRRAFRLSYLAEGALWRYPDGDFISWDAVNKERSGVPVERSTVTLRLPPAVVPDQVTYNAAGPRFAAEQEGNLIRFAAGESIPDGTPFTVAVTIPPGTIDAPIQEWQKEIDGETLALTVESANLDLTINADGTLSAVESLALTVEESYLHQAFRILPLLYREEIRAISLTRDGVDLQPGDDGCPDCYRITHTARASDWVAYSAFSDQLRIDEDAAGSVTLDWPYPALGPGSKTATEIAYSVDGALRIDDANQYVTWEILPDYGVPIEAAVVTIHLPPGVAVDDVRIDGVLVDGEPEILDDSTLRLTYQSGGERSPRWQIGLALPPDATSAVKPAWQFEFENALADQQSARVEAARRQTTRRVSGIVAIALGIVGLALGWLRWGRRRVKEQLGGYITEPPSDLDAAIVAYLVDPHGATRSILAAFYQLAAMGCLEISADPDLHMRPLRAKPLDPAETLSGAGGQPVRVSRHTAYLYNSILLPATDPEHLVSLEQLAPALREKMPQIAGKLTEDARRFFVNQASHRPRVTWRAAIMNVWFVIIAGMVLLRIFGDGFSPRWIVAAFAGLFVLFVLGNFLPNRSSGHTDEGKAEAARWARFKTYLLNIKEYGDHGAAQEIVERYFAYAVALGVEQAVMDQAAVLDAPAPTWMAPPAAGPTVLRPPRPSGHGPASGGTLELPPLAPSGGGSGAESAPAGPGGPRPQPSLSTMSEQLGAAMTAASISVGNMLSSTTGSAPTSITVAGGGTAREMNWQPGTSLSTVMDDAMRQSFSDIRQDMTRRAAEQSRSTSGSGQWGSSSGSRSSGGFGRSSSGRSSSSRRSSSGSSSSRRSGGGGRSGFG